MGTELNYLAIRASQCAQHSVLSFAARPADILRFAAIDRIGRDGTGKLQGFQRPQIASHIREIREYVRTEEAVLPNPIVVAFTEGVRIESKDDGVAEVFIDISGDPQGYVVDGQQRLSALVEADRSDFQVFVSLLVCPDEAELRRQFVLINNTRPLPKSLIYELLPTVPGLPGRLSARSFAAGLTERLNFDPKSSLAGMIRQHTNPTGIISDTAIQRVIMNSASDGALRELLHHPDGGDTSFNLLSEFYAAVEETFRDEWVGHTVRSSRLLHGAGVIAMGYVMEVLFSRDNASDRATFRAGLDCLVGETAWTSGKWKFVDGEERNWNSIQNVHREIMLLADHLIRIVRRSGPIRPHFSEAI